MAEFTKEDEAVLRDIAHDIGASPHAMWTIGNGDRGHRALCALFESGVLDRAQRNPESMSREARCAECEDVLNVATENDLAVFYHECRCSIRRAQAPAQGSTGQRHEADALPYAGMVYSQFDPKQHTTHIVGLDKQTALLERIAGTVERSELLLDATLDYTFDSCEDQSRRLEMYHRVARVREMREEARRGS